ncbi:carbonic anhydrase 1-like [Onthophagus taurus]|uniref:carbonic anhydrase 1-like n=1 Tax=Onthophagus taurus TaxID=166361 RepID=UPI000C1FFC8C|nr:carbonic anhydrase 1-like [Onthophagus taurus]
MIVLGCRPHSLRRPISYILKTNKYFYNFVNHGVRLESRYVRDQIPIFRSSKIWDLPANPTELKHSYYWCRSSSSIHNYKTTNIIQTEPSESKDTKTMLRRYETCIGLNQSPIALPLPCNAPLRANLPQFSLSESFYEIPQNITITRQSYTVKLEFANACNIKVTGIQKGTCYVLDQAHFHWGDNNAIGSEHSMNGTFYPMEIHSEFYNTKYKSFADAQTKSDGLAVFTYFVKVVQETTSSQSSTLDSIAAAIKILTQKNFAKVNVKKSFSFAEFFPILQDNYVSYHGSITTPPYYESATFIVFEKPLEISAETMAVFRSLYKVEPGTRNNFRPLQQLNGRKVFGKCRCF